MAKRNDLTVEGGGAVSWIVVMQGGLEPKFLGPVRGVKEIVTAIEEEMARNSALREADGEDSAFLLTFRTRRGRLMPEGTCWSNGMMTALRAKVQAAREVDRQRPIRLAVQ